MTTLIINSRTRKQGLLSEKSLSTAHGTSHKARVPSMNTVLYFELQVLILSGLGFMFKFGVNKRVKRRCETLQCILDR